MKEIVILISFIAFFIVPDILFLRHAEKKAEKWAEEATVTIYTSIMDDAVANKVAFKKNGEYYWIASTNRVRSLPPVPKMP